MEKIVGKAFPTGEMATITLDTSSSSALSASSSSLSSLSPSSSFLALSAEMHRDFLIQNIEEILVQCLQMKEEDEEGQTPSHNTSDDSRSSLLDHGIPLSLPFLSSSDGVSIWNQILNQFKINRQQIKTEKEQEESVRKQMKTQTQTISDVQSSLSTTAFSSMSSEFSTCHQTLLNSLLLSVQSGYKLCSPSVTPLATTSSSTEDPNLPAPVKFLTGEFSLLQTLGEQIPIKKINHDFFFLSVLLNKMKDEISIETDLTKKTVLLQSFRFHRHSFRLLLPLLDQVLLLISRVLAHNLVLHKSMLKMCHILLSCFNKILIKGFCRRPEDENQDEEDGGEPEEGPPQEKEGTGMGEGEGKKDVSDQITDEEQLLGNKEDPLEQKNEEKPEKQDDQQKNDPEEGLEMDADFEGEMHDMPSEEEDEEGKEKEQEGEELDREMGDLGDKQDVVDEKLWEESDEEEEKDPKQKEKERQEEKTERDAAIEGADASKDEIAAKDTQEEEKAPDNKKDKKKPDEPEPEQDDEMAEKAEEHKPEPSPEDEQDNAAKEGDGSDSEKDDEPEPEGMINEENEDRFEENHNKNDSMKNVPDDLKLDEDEKDEEKEGQGEEEQGEEKEDEEMADADDKADSKDTDAKPDENEGEEDDDAKMDEDDPDAADGVDANKDQNELDKEPENPEENNPESSGAVEAPPAPEDGEDLEKPEGPEKDEEEPEVERPEQHAEEDKPKDTDQGAHRVAGGQQGDAAMEDEAEKKLDAEKEQAKEDNEDAAASNPAPQKEEKPQENEDEQLDATNAQDADHGVESEWQPDAAQTHSSDPQVDENDKKKKQKPKKQQKTQPNPFKSLGDANKKWQEKLKLLQDDESKEDDPDITQLEEDENPQEEDGTEVAADATVENVNSNEKADTQMLGPVEQKLDAEEVPKLKPEDEEDESAAMVDIPQPEEKEVFDQDNPEQDAAPKPEDDPEKRKKQREQESKKRGGNLKLNPSRMTEPESQEQDEEEEGELDEPDAFDPFAGEEVVEEDEEKRLESQVGHMQDDAMSAARSAEASSTFDPTDPAHVEYLQTLRDSLDLSLSQWEGLDGGEKSQLAQQMYTRLCELTSDLSASLCESLRQILEPMLATKLRGDYKSGKRINLKKIIPYIASSFRKDKIWLKRTKPNSRAYQVLVAIDDSASMRNNKAGRLALEAMTVLCQALSSLEVGELSIASFGNGVKLVHPFGRPFTAESGAFAVGQFQFQQQFTRWPDLLESTVKLLDEAKSNSRHGSADHHQLVFIISDARVQQDRETVAKWTREALSKNQLLVLIIVESGDIKDSILSTKTVTYPNGKMKIGEYLDDFPFPYYILLRDIQSLPEIVADALRQWFELIKNSS